MRRQGIEERLPTIAFTSSRRRTHLGAASVPAKRVFQRQELPQASATAEIATCSATRFAANYTKRIAT
jgi:hypothetical protein